jgi:hypothetical protein
MLGGASTQAAGTPDIDSGATLLAGIAHIGGRHLENRRADRVR